MDIEFHHSVTYLIATKAGYSPAEAEIIAYSSQMVDDNVNEYLINKGINEYHNYISQTMNIFNPKKKLFRIYPLFHFVPGNFSSKKALRKDGKFHLLNTTPNSKNAQMLFKRAKDKKCLYKLGIACHVFADTWAHSNFVGYYESFNSMSGPLESVSPNIGHADAKTLPDEIGRVWKDTRLMEEHRDNNKIFLEAAKSLFLELGGTRKSLIELMLHLSIAFDLPNKLDRLQYFEKMALIPSYGGVALPKYDSKKWFNDAVITNGWMFSSYKKKDCFENSDWFKFQESIKWFQNTAWEVLKDSVFSKMDLKEL
ncbi:MAG: hypothetical protein M0P71_01140 [Melioribacteraceae bacterium]|nr:hypothetical protein [Melioribacteraceae bacterium]